MKKKIVVKFAMKCQKCPSKALEIAAGVSGVESASLKGDDKSQIEVTGDDVDPVHLTNLLRKRMGYAVLVSVSAVDGAKKEENKVKKKPPDCKGKEKPPDCVCACNPSYCYVYKMPLCGCDYACSCNPSYYVHKMPLCGYAQHS